MNKREHGFNYPLDNMQIYAWSNIIIYYIAWYLCYSNLVFTWCFLHYPYNVVTTVFFNVLFVITVILKILITLSSNEDDFILNASLPDIDVNDIKYCRFCQHNVYLHSRHCAICDKCIDYYDHHCVYLNTCIGRKNYKLFIAFIYMTMCTIMYQWAIGIYIFIMCFATNVRIIILGILLGYQFILMVLICALCILHLFLIINDKTTYEWLKETHIKT